MSLCSTLTIAIFYCANTTVLYMPDWKFLEGGR